MLRSRRAALLQLGELDVAGAAMRAPAALPVHPQTRLGGGARVGTPHAGEAPTSLEDLPPPPARGSRARTIQRRLRGGDVVQVARSRPGVLQYEAGTDVDILA